MIIMSGIEDTEVSSLFRRNLRSVVTHQTTTESIHKLLSDCTTIHKHCPNADPILLPTRLIDVEKMCLRETMPGELGRYTALSYSWGGDQPWKTTRHNLPAGAMTRSLNLGDLGQSLQDAITVTRQLCIPNLWIDAMCIIQGDDEDAAKEISQMASIYTNATVVIAASGSNAARKGFLDLAKPGNRRGKYQKQSTTTIKFPLRTRDNQWGQVFLTGAMNPDFIDEEHLHSRAWTFQELALAPRLLLYTKMGLVWTCCTQRKPQLVSTHLPMTPNTAFHSPYFCIPRNHASEVYSKLQKDWDMIVTAYSRRKLTYYKDRLPAIAGIASFLQSFWKCEYFAGLWAKNIEMQLGWKIHINTLEPANGEVRRPTWSWSSANGAIYDSFPSTLNSAMSFVRFVSCKITPRYESDPNGEVAWGRLELDGFIVRAAVVSEEWISKARLDRNGAWVSKSPLDNIWCLILGWKKHQYLGWAFEGLVLEFLKDETYQRLASFRESTGAESVSSGRLKKEIPDIWMTDDSGRTCLTEEARVALRSYLPNSGLWKRIVLV
jgi:hypothetical protein